MAQMVIPVKQTKDSQNRLVVAKGESGRMDVCRGLVDTNYYI